MRKVVEERRLVVDVEGPVEVVEGLVVEEEEVEEVEEVRGFCVVEEERRKVVVEEKFSLDKPSPSSILELEEKAGLAEKPIAQRTNPDAAKKYRNGCGRCITALEDPEF